MRPAFRDERVEKIVPPEQLSEHGAAKHRRMDPRRGRHAGNPLGVCGETVGGCKWIHLAQRKLG